MPTHDEFAREREIAHMQENVIGGSRKGKEGRGVHSLLVFYF